MTGSCTAIESGPASTRRQGEAGSLRILIDCGAFQGGRRETIKNNGRLPFDAQKINAVILTHAHYDHCGRLPKLVATGFRGPIFATAATADLARLVLEDSLKVMESNYQKYGVLPIFSEEQLRQAVSQIQKVKYHQKVNMGEGYFYLREAGHILGSASVELHMEGKTVMFSGDLGNNDAPIVKDTEVMAQADVVVMESTYAMREHEPPKERLGKLEQAILYTVEHHGVLLIPSFALERTQEILWELHNLADKHQLPNIKFYLDSPLAIKITEDFRHHPDIFDAEALRAYNMHHDFLSFPNLVLTPSVEESKAINNAPAPKVILAGSGMMEGGRIMHHLQRYLPLANTTVLVVGYQGENTTGRKILNGDKFVRINDRLVPVNARIVRADSYSAHADYSKLTHWLLSGGSKPRYVFLNHGEQGLMREFAQVLHIQQGLNTIVPRFGQTFKV